jgi:hypothetical protein
MRAAVQDQDAIGQVARRGQVVGDEDDAEAALALEAAQQVHHADADRHVEHRGRLVGDQELGLHRQRARDRDPLALAPRQLVGMARQHLLGRLEADRAQELDHAGAQRVLAAGGGALEGPGQVRGDLAGRVERPGAAVADQRPLEVMGDAVHRVERAEGILEDHLDPTAIGQRGAARLPGQDIDAVEADLAAVGLRQPDQHPRDRALAAA